MQVFLSKQCESLTGSLGSGFGYAIRKQRTGFFATRFSNGRVPKDGHWQFIARCAELAQNKLHITDIKVDAQEVHDALYEAGHFIAARRVLKYLQPTALMNANEIINLKTEFGL